MNLISERALGIQPYTAGEQPSGRKYIKLNTNENPYPPSPRAEEMLSKFDAGLLRRYPKPNADGLREAIAEAESVNMENVFVGNGSDEVLALSFPAFFDMGQTACFADFTYSFYEVFAAFFGVDFIKVPIREGFRLRFRSNDKNALQRLLYRKSQCAYGRRRAERAHGNIHRRGPKIGKSRDSRRGVYGLLRTVLCAADKDLR